MPEVVGPQVGRRKHAEIMRIMVEALENGWPQDRTVEAIAQIIPLDPRRAAAVTNYRRGLKDQGFAPNVIKRMVNEYVDRLKTSRASTVVRTETTRMERDRRREKRVGVRRQWVAKRGCCALCKALHGTYADNEGMYGPIVGPPAHPNCRCREIAPKGPKQ